MKRFLMSFALVILGVNAGFAVDRYGNPDVYRGAVGTAAIFRAPVIPSAPSTLPGGTTSTTTSAPSTTTSTVPAVKKYSVESCMNDMLGCVTNTLPDGINSMFNADMRNSVVNGIGLCGSQIDKCINEAARVDGKKAYYARNDVWIDFNSRVIQPTYYAFVLQKTGLTPNQAENTCWLLDKNVYGTSFSAVNASSKVTTEYDQLVTPYNELGEGDTKNFPMGPNVNTMGKVDAQRGHYARWDATTGECLVRVAAYNKEQLITNEWLFGIVGDKQPAEMWKNAGEAFVCNKDAFGFALRQGTQTFAAVVLPSTVIAGGGIGYVATQDRYDGTIDLNPENCSDKKYVNLLKRSLVELGHKQNINNGTACEEYVSNFNAATTATSEKKTNTETGEALEVEDTKAAMVSEFPTKKVIIGKMNELNDQAIGKGAGALIGAGVGLGVGGIATAISAFVEANNISCHIGDGLAQVGFEKTGRVKSLKEYYVQWNLKLPDTVMPEQTVTECNSWNTACGSIVNIADCAMAAVIYKPVGTALSTQVENACTVSGNSCVVNNPVAVSYGACL